MKRTSFGDQMDRFEALLDRMEGALRLHVGDGVAAGSSPVLTPETEKYLVEAKAAADKYVERRKWEMARERGEELSEAAD